MSSSGEVAAQPSARLVLAAMVRQSAAIFAGEVYAIRVPRGVSPAAPVRGGQPSSRADAAEVEFRVDVAIAGASIGTTYVLRMALSRWEQAPPLHLHERAMVFLRPPDADGLSGPVEGTADIPGLDLGVMPLDGANNADLTRLQRMVTRKLLAGAWSLPAAAAPSSLPPAGAPGSMPELRQPQIPLLALMRDIAVLTAGQ